MPRDRVNRAAGLAEALSSITRRLWIAAVLRASAVALPLGAVAWMLATSAGLAAATAALLVVVVTIGIAAVWLTRIGSRSTAKAAAEALEIAHPASRNVVVTAEELLRYPERATPAARARVLDDATRIAEGVAAARVVVLRRPAAFAAAGFGLLVALVTGIPQRGAQAGIRAVDQALKQAAAASSGMPVVSATIMPPLYTREPPRTIGNPDRIEALQGSRLSLEVQGGSWRIRFGPDPLEVRESGTATAVDLTLVRSGYLAIEPLDRNASKAQRLLPVMVTPDRAPAIRVEAPGKDLLLPDASPIIGLAASAADDYGLQSLELRYTKVSGSGEQFEFNEGSLPLTITRESTRNWKARTDLALSRLGLAPGDTVIYRFVGRDERAGDVGLTSSDTFFIEVAGPGQVALAGFELPPDRERYALSQQMIVLKLERLRAREHTIDRAMLEQEAGNIAAEQRAVRANFVFLMGGEVENEEAEAEHSHEIQEGRLENTARREIVEAIQHMGKVEAGLAAVSTTAALPPARAAVEALQRAFGRNRYFLRTLPVRSRVDPSRRLSGEISTASDWRRELPAPVPEASVIAARGLLARLLEIAPTLKTGSTSPQSLTTLAEDALAVDPASEDWQAVSKGLLQLREAVGTEVERSATLNQIVSRVAAIADRVSLAMRPLERNPSLKSAWAEASR